MWAVWPLITAVSWVIGLATGYTAGFTVSELLDNYVSFDIVFAALWGTTYITFGAVSGAITGGGLVWLLRQSRAATYDNKM